MSKIQSVAREIIEIDELFESAFALKQDGKSGGLVMNMARNRLKLLKSEAEKQLGGQSSPELKETSEAV